MRMSVSSPRTAYPEYDTNMIRGSNQPANNIYCWAIPFALICH
jgi:hypothetical protein